MRRRSVLAVSMAGTLFAACGGGGGGGSSAVKPAVPFTSFSAVQSGQPVQATGMSQTVSATTNPVSIPVNVTSTTVNAVDTASSSAQLTYGTLPSMTAFSLSAPQSSVSFSGMNIQCTPGTGVCGGSSPTTVAVVINPLDPPNPTLAWNYQSFGYWLTFPSASNALAGAISFGNVTPVAGIPASGTATYTGLSSGGYVDQTGAVFVHAAQMQSTVDFGPARSVAFSTSNTTISPVNTTTPTAFPALNLTGNLTIPLGVNQFTGAVTAPGGIVNGVVTPAMTGTATGRFYGPTAQEIGGVFSLKRRRTRGEPADDAGRLRRQAAITARCGQRVRRGARPPLVRVLDTSPTCGDAGLGPVRLSLRCTSHPLVPSRHRKKKSRRPRAFSRAAASTEAQAIVSRLRQSPNPQLQVLFLSGELYFLQQRYIEAAEEFRLMLARDPSARPAEAGTGAGAVPGARVRCGALSLRASARLPIARSRQSKCARLPHRHPRIRSELHLLLRHRLRFEPKTSDEQLHRPDRRPALPTESKRPGTTRGRHAAGRTRQGATPGDPSWFLRGYAEHYDYPGRDLDSGYAQLLARQAS